MAQSRWAKRREALGRVKLKHVCYLCGWGEYSSGLDFHHVHGPKVDTISQMIRLSYQLIVTEVRKCVVLCACCHRGVHSGDVQMRYKKNMGVKMSQQEILWIQ